MLMLLDIGNSRIKVGLTQLETDFFVSIKSFKKTDSLINYIKNTQKRYQIKYLVYSSVRGKETDDLIKKVKTILKKDIFFDRVKYFDRTNYIDKTNSIDKFNENKNISFQFFYDPITSYGDDRLSILYYIFEKYPKDTIFAIDSGTALTIDTMHKSKYEGGCIASGINLSVKSLFYKTRQLPLIKSKDISEKENINKIKNELFGFSTKDSILSGIYNLFTGFIIYSYDLFINKIEKNYKEKVIRPKIILTGGDSHLIYELIKDKLENIEIIIDENAVLSGLKSYLKFKIKNSNT